MQDHWAARCRECLAQLEGVLKLPGLRGKVEVLRDRWGVPHLYAGSEQDLFFAQGVVAAQDRLFQMDLWRRIGRGELAAIAGPRALPSDRFARRIRYRGDWEAEWNSYGPRTRDICTAFTAGINAYIDHLGDRLPIEFQVLDCTPGRWVPEDCLARMSGVSMVRNLRQELERARLAARVGLEAAQRLAPVDPPVPWEPAAEIDLAAVDVEAILAEFLAATGAVPITPADGSNNWVIPGCRSRSGHPLHASDPHRAIGLPALRYLIHLVAPGWNVIGAGEPALPGVALGHNEHVAWGFTIVGTDQADVCVEQLHPEHPRQYRVGQRWDTMRIERERIDVRGQAAETVELEFTRNGPVLYRDPERRLAYVLRWVGSEPGTAAYLGSLRLDQAGSAAEFRAALASWKVPSENMVFADTAGHTGWVAAALTPVRARGTGLLPVPGWDDAYRWQRFLALDEVPQTADPAEPLSTANHNILPPGYARMITYEWSPPYRQARLQQLLGAAGKFTLADLRGMQHDNVSLPGQALAQLAGRLRLPDARFDALRQQFSRWDGALNRDQRWGPLYACWLEALLQEFFAPRVPPDCLPFVAAQRGVPVVLGALLRPDETWFGPDPEQGRDSLARRTFVQAAQQVEQLLGPDSTAWRWDRLHTVQFQHPLRGRGEDWDRTVHRGPVPQAGDGLCPNATRYEQPFAQVSGASYRHLFDLADWDAGLATSTPGQSGQPGSPHYDDLLPLWQRDEYFPLLYSRGKVEQATRWKLVLEPAGA